MNKSLEILRILYRNGLKCPTRSLKMGLKIFQKISNFYNPGSQNFGYATGKIWPFKKLLLASAPSTFLFSFIMIYFTKSKDLQKTLEKRKYKLQGKNKKSSMEKSKLKFPKAIRIYDERFRLQGSTSSLENNEEIKILITIHDSFLLFHRIFLSTTIPPIRHFLFPSKVAI